MVKREWVDESGTYHIMTDGDVWEQVWLLLDPLVGGEAAGKAAQVCANAFAEHGPGYIRD